MAASKPAEGEPQESTKIRCFVLIGGVPTTLAADELKKIMRDQTNDLMEVKILDSAEGVDENGKHFALALFGSQRAALATCKQGIIIDGEDEPLRMFAMSGEKKASVEKVFSDTIEVEGDVVPKASLCVTVGLAAALKGQAIAKWCAQTKVGEDCPLGNSCRFIHRRSTQRTARRQRSVEFEEGLDEGIPRLEWFTKDNLSTYFPGDILESTQSTFVALTNAELSAFIQRAQKTTGAKQQHQTEGFPPELQSLLEKIKGVHASLGKGSSPSSLYFPKLNIAQGAPTDTPFSDAPVSSALAQKLLAHSGSSPASWVEVLKRQVPFPEGGLPTPSRRDRYCLKLWLQAQRNLQCDVKDSSEQFAEKVLTILLSSERVLLSVKRFRAENNGASTADPSLGSGVSICLAPWLDIPSPFHCVRLFYMQGDAYCALQKEDYLLHNAVETATENIIKIETAIDRAVQSLNQRITASFADASLASHIIRDFPAVPKSVASSAQYTFCVDAVVVPGRSEAVILSVEEFAPSAAANALFPAEPLNNLTTRFRVRKSCETQHLPREWLKIITR